MTILRQHMADLASRQKESGCTLAVAAPHNKWRGTANPAFQALCDRVSKRIEAYEDIVEICSTLIGICNPHL
jgi:uncharacterized protein YukE